jgi:hypothetical protein
MSITISRSYKYVDYNVSAPNNRGYLTIDNSSWIDYPWMFYELPALKFEIYTESGGELLKYKNFTREIRTYNPVYSPLGVLNVTIDIRNVPEEFILRITPIFDNDAIAARNMLIENGIENGEIWGKDQDIPTQSFDLDLEFIECSGEYIPPVPPTHEKTITGVPPITFDGSTGEPLVSWTILGNGQQTGTPSPQNIIMPTFCGVRTENLWSEDYTGISQTIKYVPIYVGNGDVTISTTCGRSGTGAGAAAVLFLLAGSVSTGASTDGNGVWNGNDRTVSAVDGYVTVAFRAYTTANPDNAETMLNLGSTALPYEPYGWAEKITCGGETTPVYLGEVPTVRRIKKAVFTGQETWTEVYPGEPEAQAQGIVMYATSLSEIGTDRNDFICSHFFVGNYRGYLIPGQGRINGTSPESFNVNYNNGSDGLQNFKAWLASEYAAGHPVTLWYALATEQTSVVNEPLCKIGDYADELHSTDAGVTIPTSDGNNVLTVETDLQPSEMTITYIKEE